MGFFGDLWEDAKDTVGDKWDSVVNSHKDPIGELGNVAGGDAGDISLGGGGGAGVRQVNPLTSQVGDISGQVNDMFLHSANPRYAPVVQGAELDKSGMNAGLAMGGLARRDQGALTGQLQAAASGAVPSAAEIQMRQGLEQSLRGQLAAANSARGGTGAGLAAIRGARDQGSAMQAQAMQQAGAMRANEQAAARGLLSGHLSGMRGADMDVAGMGLQAGTAQAGLDQQAALANADNALASRGLDDARQLGLGGLAGEYMGMDLDRQVQEQQLGLDRDLGILGVDSDIAQAQAANNMEKRKGGLGMVGSIVGGIMGG